MKYLPYNTELRDRSRDLRNHSTRSEIMLWNQIKGRRMKGYQFNRQKPLGPFIVDFYCKALNLVIEIDGISHDSDEAKRKDARRQMVLERMGLKFLRFRDEALHQDLSFVLKEIERFIEFNAPSDGHGAQRRVRSARRMGKAGKLV